MSGSESSGRGWDARVAYNITAKTIIDGQYALIKRNVLFIFSIRGVFGFGGAVLPDVFFGGEGEFVIPIFAETGDEWLAEELVGADSAGAPEHFGAFADFPAVVVHSGCAVGKLLDARRIEVAGNGFAECDAPFAECFLNGADT